MNESRQCEAAAFLRQIALAPWEGDDRLAHALIFADWLSDHGDEREEQVRAERAVPVLYGYKVCKEGGELFDPEEWGPTAVEHARRAYRHRILQLFPEVSMPLLQDYRSLLSFDLMYDKWITGKYRFALPEIPAD